jgi:hypothetical protein
MAAPNRVIATAGIIAISVGSVNAIAKDKRLPSSRFLIGSGVAFLILSALSEAEPELAQAFAVAICTTVVLGEGGGVLSYINNGEMDTQKRDKSFTPKDAPGEHEVVQGGEVNATKGDVYYALPGINMPIIPNLVPTTR